MEIYETSIFSVCLFYRLYLQWIRKLFGPLHFVQFNVRYILLLNCFKKCLNKKLDSLIKVFRHWIQYLVLPGRSSQALSDAMGSICELWIFSEATVQPLYIYIMPCTLVPPDFQRPRAFCRGLCKMYCTVLFTCEALAIACSWTNIHVLLCWMIFLQLVAVFFMSSSNTKRSNTFEKDCYGARVYRDMSFFSIWNWCAWFSCCHHT